jgi:hypothetical protein
MPCYVAFVRYPVDGFGNDFAGAADHGTVPFSPDRTESAIQRIIIFRSSSSVSGLLMLNLSSAGPCRPMINSEPRKRIMSLMPVNSLRAGPLESGSLAAAWLYFRQMSIIVHVMRISVEHFGS